MFGFQGKGLGVNSWITLIPGKYIYLQNKTYLIQANDTLVDLAVRFRVGYQHLVMANPKVDPWLPKESQVILIPYQILIPKEFIKPKKIQYIFINLPEMRLYYFNYPWVFVAPIGIGTEGKLPPLGNYTIINKKEKPFWYPPPSIRAEDPTLPPIVPPGPDNPLGDYALYLSKGLYALHGTNKIYSIGRRTTHGCIRLYPDHIKFLFDEVPMGTQVEMIYEPYKLAVEGKEIYLQAFPDIENLISNPFLHVLKKVETLLKDKDFVINLLLLEEILKNPDGLVHKIGEVKEG